MAHSSPITVAQLCERLKIEAPLGIAAVEIRGATTVEHAREGDATYVLKPRFADAARASKAAVVIVPARMAFDDPRALPVPDVWMAMLALLEHFFPEPEATGERHPTAVVHPTATLAEGVTLGPYVVIGENARIGAHTIVESHSIVERDVVVGERCRLYARATLRHGTRLGNRVLVHAGAVIGDDGFKYEVAGGRLRKIPQVGVVVIEDDVEIGANTTIDRAGFHETRIGARTKIDNLCHIAHNVTVASDCIVVAQVGIAGSSRIGRGVMIGGQAGIADNVVVGDGAKIAAQSGTSGNIPAGAQVFGSPAVPMSEVKRQIKAMRKLPDILEKLGPYIRGLGQDDDAQD